MPDQWPLQEVHRRLDERMTKTFRAVYDVREERRIHTRAAAYTLSIQRVAQAVYDRGWIPKATLPQKTQARATT
ncbi:MAG: hypothetical protein C4341_00575 [Armatimonadota bacterium]